MAGVLGVEEFLEEEFKEKELTEWRAFEETACHFFQETFFFSDLILTLTLLRVPNWMQSMMHLLNVVSQQKRGWECNVSAAARAESHHNICFIVSLWQNVLRLANVLP